MQTPYFLSLNALPAIQLWFTRLSFVCLHSTEVDVRGPGQQRVSSVPGLGHLPRSPHHILCRLHPDSRAAGCWYDERTKKHMRPHVQSLTR